MFWQKNILNEPLKWYKNERYYENTTAINKEDAKYLLLTMNKVFKEHGIALMPAYGTLLGAVREHDFISHDFDVDTIIWAKDMQKALDLAPELEKYGIKLHCYVLPWIFTYEYHGATCDIDVLHEAVWPWNVRYVLLHEMYIEKSFFSNTAPLEFLGDTFTAPADLERLMVYHFGKNWRIPASTPSRVESKVFFWRYAHRFLQKCLRYMKRHWLKKK